MIHRGTFHLAIHTPQRGYDRFQTDREAITNVLPKRVKNRINNIVETGRNYNRSTRERRETRCKLPRPRNNVM